MNFGYKLLADGAYVIELEDPTGSSNDYIDVKEGSAGLRLEISGLSAGEHTLMAYHNASEGWTAGLPQTARNERLRVRDVQP